MNWKVILRRLLVKVGFLKRSIPPSVTKLQPSIMPNSTLPFNLNFIGSARPELSIGEGTYINGADLYCWNPKTKFTIGKYCAIADKVTIILGGEHDKDWVSSYQFIELWQLEKYYSVRTPRVKGNISIGNDVWIGNNVTILSNVRIGDGAVIGAGSMITKDVDPYAIVGGNPARLIKFRFPDTIIADMQSIEWWNWSRERIIDEMIPFLTNPQQFIDSQKAKYK